MYGCPVVIIKKGSTPRFKLYGYVSYVNSVHVRDEIYDDMYKVKHLFDNKSKWYTKDELTFTGNRRYIED